jgi:[ribosomal protein S5]-alanine N-acetyltransferase
VAQVALDERSFFRCLPLLETKRLRLRPLKLDDATDVFAYAQDPLVSQHVLWHQHHQLSDAITFVKTIVRKYENGEVAEWGIELKSERVIVGTCGFVNYSAEHRKAEVGYALARRLWGNGMASEALEAVVRIAFDELNLNRLEARCTLENKASMRVLDRAGFSREGLMPAQLWIKGSFHDVAYYGRLKHSPMRSLAAVYV